jgi:hypothetical protein
MTAMESTALLRSPDSTKFYSSTSCESLKSMTHEIRLLKLLPGAADGTIRCELKDLTL